MSFFTVRKHSELVLRCDPALVYEILTEYDSYSEWMPILGKSKLLAKEGDLAIAEFQLLHPGNDLFVVECIHTRNKMVLWRTIRGKIPVIEVEWTIASSDSSQCRVQLAMDCRRTWFRKSPYRAFMDTERCLKALQSQVTAFQPDVGGRADEARILEITETADGLVCWLQGKKYILTPVPEGNK